MIFTSIINGNRVVTKFSELKLEELCELRLKMNLKGFWSSTCDLNVQSQPVDFPSLRSDCSMC